jgi:outer membrane protein assembly factor BamB
MRLSRLFLITALSVTTTGCSTFSTVQDWFASEGEDLTAPVELERIDATVDVKKQWSTSIGDGQGDGFFKITPPS